MKSLRYRTKSVRRLRAGFTLVELMMVMVVMSILIGVLTVMGATGLKAFSRAQEDAEIVRNVTATFEIVRRDLLGAVYLNPATGTPFTIDSGGTATAVNFRGINAVSGGQPNDQVRFYAFASPDAANLRTDISTINYRLATVGGVTRFERAFLQMQDSLPPLDLSGGAATFEPLLFNVTAFDATYLNLPTGAGTYQATYDASVSGVLPRAVRLVLVVRNQAGKLRAFTQTVTLPMP